MLLYAYNMFKCIYIYMHDVYIYLEKFNVLYFQLTFPSYCKRILFFSSDIFLVICVFTGPSYIITMIIDIKRPHLCVHAEKTHTHTHKKRNYKVPLAKDLHSSAFITLSATLTRLIGASSGLFHSSGNV